MSRAKGVELFESSLPWGGELVRSTGELRSRWLGGLIGASYIIATLQLGPKIGAALLLALILAGQMTASLVVDHFGLLGFPHHPVNVARLAGAVLLVVGAILIVKN